MRRPACVVRPGWGNLHAAPIQPLESRFVPGREPDVA